MEPTLRYVDLAKAAKFDMTENNVRKSSLDTMYKGPQSFCISYDYINGTAIPITVIDRRGLVVEIPPVYDPRQPHFIIRLTIARARNVKINLDNLLNSTVGSVKILGQVIRDGEVEYRHGVIKNSLEYHLTTNEIERLGGNLYLNEMDIVVSSMHEHLRAPHPYSEKAIRNDLISGDPNINEIESFGFSLRIVDSLKIFGNRFININNKIYKVPVNTTANMPDGVYLSSSGTVDSDHSLIKPIAKRYDFEEADEALGLYKTIEEAKTLGDIFAQREQEIKETAFHIKEMEMNMKKAKLERDDYFDNKRMLLEEQRQEDDLHRKREEAIMARKLLRAKEELAEMEHRRNVIMLETKDRYEHRSMERKDSGEIIKFLPVVVTGILALFVAFSKFKS